jgi:hypothetical protein
MMAIAWEEFNMTPQEAESSLRQIVEDGVTRGLVKPCCGVCGSEDLRYEDGVTRFDSLNEAEGEIIQIQAENLKAKRMLDALRN